MACDPALYPELIQDWATRVIPNSGHDVNLTVGGSVRSRSLFSVTSYNIELHHNLIGDIDRSTLLSFYDSNKNNEFTILMREDNVIYTVIFTNEPESEPIAFDNWNVTVNLTGIKCIDP